MLSKGGNNEILATWGEGNDPNASVFGALDPADQALRDEAIDKDTDRAWGQIDDWADRIDGQRPIVQQEFQHAEIREAESGLFNTGGCVPCQGAHRLHQKRSFLVLKEGGHLVSAVQPVSQEEAAMHHVSGVMMRLAPSGDVLGRIGRLLEEGTIRPDVATVYALQDAAQAWKDIAEKLPRVHGMSPSEPGAPRRKKHGKIVLRVA